MFYTIFIKTIKYFYKVSQKSLTEWAYVNQSFSFSWTLRKVLGVMRYILFSILFDRNLIVVPFLEMYVWRWNRVFSEISINWVIQVRLIWMIVKTITIWNECYLLSHCHFEMERHKIHQFREIRGKSNVRWFEKEGVGCRLFSKKYSL